MSELVATLLEGDKIIIEHPNIYVERAYVPVEEAAIVIINDPHVGSGRYNPDELQQIVNHIVAEHDPLWIIVNGDASEHGTVEELQEYLSLWPSNTIHMRGNHDEPKGYDDPPPTEYTNYDAIVGSPYQYAFTIGNYRLIFVTTNLQRAQLFKGMAYLSDAGKAFIDQEKANLGALIPVVVSHFPLHDELGNNLRDYVGVGTLSGQANVFNLFKAPTHETKKYYFSGHRHVGLIKILSSVVPHLTEVQGPCLAYDAQSPNGGYLVVRLGENVELEEYAGRFPFGLRSQSII